tara:strand:- start:15 stop:197 length:183 start_codon:yes stop_codon:yes gene_type:complete
MRAIPLKSLAGLFHQEIQGVIGLGVQQGELGCRADTGQVQFMNVSDLEAINGEVDVLSIG